MDYMTNQLPSSIRTQFETHLDECPDCVAYMEAYRQTVSLVQAMGDRRNNHVPESQCPADLVKAILEARKLQNSPPSKNET
jgi:anti-sigma factor RsiW